MNHFTFLKRAAFLGFSIFVAASAVAQEKDKKKDAKPAGADDMAMMEAMAKPGENHKLLQRGTGTWTYTMKWWMDPNSPPIESKGTVVMKEAMGGRYVIADYSGTNPMPGPDGKPSMLDFKGHGIDGYDNAKKKFVSSWIDNMGTGIMLSEGTYDAKTKSITYHAEVEMVPGTISKMKAVLKFIDDDHTTFEFYEVKDGKDVMNMEIKSTRKR